MRISATDNSEIKQSDFVQFSVSFQPLQQRRQSSDIYEYVVAVKTIHEFFTIFEFLF